MPNNNGPIRPEIQRKISPFVGRGGGLALVFPLFPLFLPLITEVKSQVGAAVILAEPDNIFHLTT